MIISISRNFNGVPNIVFIETDYTYAQVTTTGFLIQPQVEAEIAAANNGFFEFQASDYILVKYVEDVSAFTYDSATGSLSATGGGGVSGPTTPGAIAVFQDTIGTIGMDGDPAYHNSDLQAGFNNTAGSVTSYPPGFNKGYLKITAVDVSPGNFHTTLVNDSTLAQSSTYTFPNPSNTNARVMIGQGTVPFVKGNLVTCFDTFGVMEDSGAALYSGTTPVWAGGGTTHVFSALGLIGTSVGNCTILTSTNNVSVTKAVPGVDQVSVTFSADPGANTSLTFMYTTFPLTPV